MPSLADMYASPGGVAGALPEAYANPNIGPGAIVKDALTSLFTLPRRAIEASTADMQSFGDHSQPLQSVGPALETATTMIGGGMPMAERGAVGAAGGRLPNFFAGDKLKTLEETAESIWQTNNGKLKKANEEIARMRMFAGRTGHTPEDLAQIESLVAEHAKKPFVSQAKMDRMSEKAADMFENKGALTLDDLRTAFPKEKPETLGDILGRLNGR